MSAEQTESLASDSHVESQEAQQGGAHRVLWRVAALVLVVGALYAVGKYSGVSELGSLEALEAQVRDAGAWGWLVFAGIFILLNQMHVPGMFFLVAALWLFGPWQGALVGWISAQTSLAIHYAVIRTIGGAPLEQSERPWLKRWVERLKQRPLRAMIVIRVVMVMSPTVNIPVILSGIGFRDYMIGSAIGLALVLGVCATGFELFEPWFRQLLAQ